VATRSDWLSRRGAPIFIALARIVIGVMWLFALRWKLPLDFAPDTGRGLLDWMQLAVQHPTFDFYAAFVENTVIPHFTLFAWLVFLGELLVGLALVTGTLTRLAAFGGLLMSINIGFGLFNAPDAGPWFFVMLVMWHLLFLIANAGMLLGVDGFVRNRRPRRTLLLPDEG
jgi:uncharacterized membrane protein YphA (DoxX/SURF4 family)